MLEKVYALRTDRAEKRKDRPSGWGGGFHLQIRLQIFVFCGVEKRIARYSRRTAENPLAVEITRENPAAIENQHFRKFFLRKMLIYPGFLYSFSDSHTIHLFTLIKT